MSGLAFWTWAAIVVLVAGSAGVFAWFLTEALLARGREPDADGARRAEAVEPEGRSAPRRGRAD